MSANNTKELVRRKPTSRSVKDFKNVKTLRGALQSMGEPISTDPAAQTSWGSEDVVVGVQKPLADFSKIDAVVPLILPPTKQLELRGRSTRVTGSYGNEEAAVKKELEKDLRRMAVLKSYGVVGSGMNPAYERLVSLASRIFNAPIAYVSVLDLSKHYFLAARGLGAMTGTEQDRESYICAHLVDGDDEIMVIPDLSLDDQFKDHRNVKGLPNLRFYAASPLICPEGVRLGTLCVLDTVPRPGGLSFDMKQNLREIADMVMDVMVEERERKIFEYRQPSQMIACTSNDLMTPLVGIVEGLSTIRDDRQLLSILSNQQKEVFNTAFACSTVMTRICEKSLESFNRSQQNREESKSGKSDDSKVNTLDIQELVRYLHMVMDPFPKRVPLVVTVSDDVPPVIVADDLKVFRSVVNYLTNACAITDTGSVHLKIFVTDEAAFSESNEQQRIVFLVEDTGCGVSVDQYQNLFKPVVGKSYEEDVSCTLASFGDDSAKTMKTGLGLFSVATQITSIGGTYGFRPRGFNEYGSQLHDENGGVLKGSIFWFSIPLVVPSDADGNGAKSTSVAVIESDPDQDDNTTHDKRKWNADDEAALDEDFLHAVSVGEKRSFEAFVGEPTARRKRKALVIDDSLTTRRIMSRMLSRLGFEVAEAVNGLEGLKQLQANLYDLVLCDFLMPVMDGSDCVQQYRQYELASRPWFDQYIVGISAHANDGDVERGMKVGMNDYLAKPVTIKQLEEILKGQEFKYVSTRLDSITAGIQTPDEAAKQHKTADEEGWAVQGEKAMKVCLILEEGDTISSVAEKVSEECGWKSVVVHNGEAALRLLQMRNWDGVLIDDTLPGLSSCSVMKRFREWELNNRVNRQKNVYQVNSSFIPSHFETNSTVQLPTGFDGALGKPVSAKLLKQFFQRSVDGKNCMSHNIVRR